MVMPDKPMADETKTADKEKSYEGVDMVGISRILLRVLAQLDEREYTDSHKGRQAEVLAHDDPPNPASEESTTRG